MSDYPTVDNLAERLAKIEGPTSTFEKDDLRRIKLTLSSMPYLGGVVHDLLRRDLTVKAVTEILAALAVELSKAADRHRVVEGQLWALQADVDGFRRIVGTLPPREA